MPGFQMRIENESRGRLLLVQPVKQTVEESRLACPDFARQKHKTLARFNPVSEFVQRRSGARSQIQVFRVRIDIEGIFAQAKELFVHVGLGSVAPMLRYVNFKNESAIPCGEGTIRTMLKDIHSSRLHVRDSILKAAKPCDCPILYSPALISAEAPISLLRPQYFGQCTTRETIKTIL